MPPRRSEMAGVGYNVCIQGPCLAQAGLLLADDVVHYSMNYYSASLTALVLIAHGRKLPWVDVDQSPGG